MTIKVGYMIRTKISINEKVTEQVRNFNYLGYDISYDNDRYINNKHHNKWCMVQEVA